MQDIHEGDECYSLDLETNEVKPARVVVANAFVFEGSMLSLATNQV